MLSELFRESSYNIKIANILGLESAVYLSTILSLNDTTDIDREYIKSVTTLSVDKQRSIDLIFVRLNIFELRSKDNININYPALLALYNENNEDILNTTIPKVTKRRTKSDAIRDELKLLIKTDNGELRDAYMSWIDSVFAKQGWMSKKSVELGQKLVDNYSNRNLDLAIELLNIASVGGYRDIQWAINSYEENLKKKVSRAPLILNTEFEVKKKIDLAQEVF